MWLFLNDSFLSIVAHHDKPGVLLVRARKAGEIKALFPKAESWKGGGTDYQFRAEIPAEHVAKALSQRIQAIDYGNFKNSVKDHSRHDAYFQVWEVMGEWGRKSPHLWRIS